MRTGLFVQARLNSERLQKKMFKTLYKDKTIIYLCLQSVNDWDYDEKALLVPYGEKDYFKDVAQEFNFPIIEGPELDVLGRFILGLYEFPNLDLVTRVCADKVIFAKDEQNYALCVAKEHLCDLTHYANDPIRSVTAGIYKAYALWNADLFYKDSIFNPYREHIKPLFTTHEDFWNIETIETDNIKNTPVDVSIDTEEDITKMREVFSNFYAGYPLDFWDLVDWFDKKENEN